MIQKDKLKLPPRQKKIITRKPDISLSRSETSRKKFKSKNKTLDSTGILDLSFISFKEDTDPQTPKKTNRNALSFTVLSNQCKNMSPNINRFFLNQPNSGKPTYGQNIYVKSTTSVNNSIDNPQEAYNQSKFYGEIQKLKQQNYALSMQNRRLKQQLDSQKREKNHSYGNKFNSQYVQSIKQNEQLRYQCHFLKTTIQQLQQKLNFSKKQFENMKTSYDILMFDANVLRQSKQTIQTLNICLEQTISDLKMQSQTLSQEIRYLNISLGIKERKQLQSKKIEKQNIMSEQLKKKNKMLRYKIMQLKQKTLIDDIIQLTPEKDR